MNLLLGFLTLFYLKTLVYFDEVALFLSLSAIIKNVVSISAGQIVLLYDEEKNLDSYINLELIVSLALIFISLVLYYVENIVLSSTVFYAAILNLESPIAKLRNHNKFSIYQVYRLLLKLFVFGFIYFGLILTFKEYFSLLIVLELILLTLLIRKSRIYLSYFRSKVLEFSDAPLKKFVFMTYFRKASKELVIKSDEIILLQVSGFSDFFFIKQMFTPLNIFIGEWLNYQLKELQNRVFKLRYLLFSIVIFFTYYLFISNFLFTLASEDFELKYLSVGIITISITLFALRVSSTTIEVFVLKKSIHLILLKNILIAAIIYSFNLYLGRHSQSNVAEILSLLCCLSFFEFFFLYYVNKKKD